MKQDLSSKGVNVNNNETNISLEEMASKVDLSQYKNLDNDKQSSQKIGILNELVKSASNSNNQNSQQIGQKLLLTDPTERERGYRDLDRWVEGSLDVYRPQLRPILFPIFVHTYLDLISLSLQKSARSLLHRHANSLVPFHADTIAHLGSLTLPSHVRSDSLAQRWRSQKYIVRLGKAAWNLLLGWLSDALVGGPGGNSQGGTAESKGRACMLKIVNERLRVDIVESSTKISQEMIEESTGLISDLTITYPTSPGQRMSIAPNAQTFNSAVGELKLGLPPLDDGLRAEVDRQVNIEDGKDKNEDKMDVDSQSQNQQQAQQPEQQPEQQQQQQSQPQSQQQSQQSQQSQPNQQQQQQQQQQSTDLSQTTTDGIANVTNGEIRDSNNLLAPTRADLPPLPVFRTADVKREVEKVFDGRKRIRLGVEVERGTLDDNVKTKTSLPSICAFTFQDVGDTLNCSSFSPDSTILAGGFSDSTIRLWNLKGESFKPLNDKFDRNDPPNNVKRLKLDDGPNNLKFIGHSGPIFGISFDPSFGSPIPPRHMISASADSTVRLWSMETYSNLSVYRGHRDPIWDCEWGPFGIYFATGSRDRTARLWSAERPNSLRIFAGHLGDVDVSIKN